RVAGLHLRDGDQRKAGELELPDLEQVGVQGGLVGHVENSNAEVRLQYFEPGVVEPPEKQIAGEEREEGCPPPPVPPRHLLVLRQEKWDPPVEGLAGC